MYIKVMILVFINLFSRGFHSHHHHHHPRNDRRYDRFGNVEETRSRVFKRMKASMMRPQNQTHLKVNCTRRHVISNSSLHKDTTTYTATCCATTPPIVRFDRKVLCILTRVVSSRSRIRVWSRIIITDSKSYLRV